MPASYLKRHAKARSAGKYNKPSGGVLPVTSEPTSPPPRPIPFCGLTTDEQRLWSPLRKHLKEAGGFLFDQDGGLTGQLRTVLRAHGVESDRKVLELVMHLVSAGKLTKLSRGGVVLGIALPSYNAQLARQLE